MTKVTLLLLALTTMMSNVAVVTVIPHLKDYFSNSNIELLSRLMITLPSLTIALTAPFLGHLIYKIGRKKITLFALLFFALTGSSGLYLETLNMILLSRALFGLNVAMLMIVSTSLVGDYFTGEARNNFMGWQSAFTSIGGVIFVVGGGILSDINWRLPFGIYLIGFLLIPFVIFFLKKTNFQAEEEEENTNPDTRLLNIYFLAFLLMLVFYIMPTQMPFLMINHFHASGTLTGSIISSAFVFNAFGALTFARLKRFLNYDSIYILGMGIVSIGFTLIGLVTEVHYFFITASMMGFGAGILMTNVIAWMLSKASPDRRIKSSGYLTSSFFFGQFFSPIITMPIVSYFGVQHFFIVMGSIVGTMVFISFCFKFYFISVKKQEK